MRQRKQLRRDGVDLESEQIRHMAIGDAEVGCESMNAATRKVLVVMSEYGLEVDEVSWVDVVGSVLLAYGVVDDAVVAVDPAVQHWGGSKAISC